MLTNMEIFKNRKIDYNKPVYIYRNLNKKGRVFSIRQNGLVVAHTKEFALFNCNFIIRKSAKLRAIKEQKRNVHAFIKGNLGDIDDIHNSFSWVLKYDPFSENGFVAGDEHSVQEAFTVYTQGNYLMTQI